MRILALVISATILFVADALGQPAHRRPPAGNNCIEVIHPIDGGGEDRDTLTIEPIPNLADWITKPALFVHEEYGRRGTCSLPTMDCRVLLHDVVWLAGPTAGPLLMSRKRGGSHAYPEYDQVTELGFDGTDGRYLVAKVPAGPIAPAREVYILPLGKRSCPSGWYPKTSTGNPQDCRLFRIEVFNRSSDQADQDIETQLPSNPDNWKPCVAARAPANPSIVGSAHEPP
jgi:hypothetical protein